MPGFTLEDARRHAQRHGYKLELDIGAKPAPDNTTAFVDRAAAKSEPKMNRTETEFARILQARQDRGEIKEWAYEPFSLRYGDKAFYKADFVAMHPHSLLSIADLTRMASVRLIEATDEDREKIHIRNIQPPNFIDIIEVKGGHIFDSAKPRFRAAKLRHPWATFSMIQKKAGLWTKLQ